MSSIVTTPEGRQIKPAQYGSTNIATPATAISTPTEPQLWIAVEAGTYASFGNLTVTKVFSLLYYSGSAWSVIPFNNELIGSNIIFTDTEIETPTEPIFYIAGEAGTYENLDDLVVASAMSIIYFDGEDWIVYKPVYEDASGIVEVQDETVATVVQHGLSYTPLVTQFIITPLDDMGDATKWWLSTVGATEFTMNVNLDPGKKISFAWRIIS